jgi:large subunit ribosomal protein L22
VEAKAIAKYIRVSPRKARQVIDLIRGKNVKEALTTLKFTPKVIAGTIIKVIKSAQANAEHNYNMNSDKLYISKAYVNQGSVLKRVFPRAKGRADVLRKPTSHIIIVVKEKIEKEK